FAGQIDGRHEGSDHGLLDQRLVHPCECARLCRALQDRHQAHRDRRLPGHVHHGDVGPSRRRLGGAAPRPGIACASSHHTAPYKTRDKCPIFLDLLPYLAILLHTAPGKKCGGKCCRCAVAGAPPMAKKLTENRVRLARVPANQRQVFLWDSQVTGFGVRIFPGDNKKTFWFMYRPEGGRRSPSGTVISRMVRIGTFPTLTVADARKAARKFAGQVARGEDPAAKRRAERTRSA